MKNAVRGAARTGHPPEQVGAAVGVPPAKAQDTSGGANSFHDSERVTVQKVTPAFFTRHLR